MTMFMPRCLLLLVIALVLGGCPRHQPELLATPTAMPTMIELAERLPPDELPPPMKLGAGDILEVTLSGSDIQQEVLRVEVDGRLYVGPARIVVAGKTMAEASTACEDALRPWFRDPQVDLRPLQILSGKITILGMVLKPGVFPLVGGERALDVLGMCGGSMKSSEFSDSEELADLTGALFIRGDRVLPVDLDALFKRGDTRQNIRVHPGDYIYIPPANERTVLVLGAVNNPGIIDLRDGMGLAAVIGRAGGYTEDTYLDWALIIRGSRAKPMVARLDLGAILAGTGADVPLKPGDIIYMPGRDDESPRRFIDAFNNGFVGAFTAAWANDVYNRVRGR